MARPLAASLIQGTVLLATNTIRTTTIQGSVKACTPTPYSVDEKDFVDR